MWGEWGGGGLAPTRSPSPPSTTPSPPSSTTTSPLSYLSLILVSAAQARIKILSRHTAKTPGFRQRDKRTMYMCTWALFRVGHEATRLCRTKRRRTDPGLFIGEYTNRAGVDRWCRTVREWQRLPWLRIASKQTASGCNVWRNGIMNRRDNHRHEGAPRCPYYHLTNAQSDIQSNNNTGAPKS